ncbi:MAG: hypothetical protein QM483_14015 [Desulfuromusa sp.]
MTEQATELQLFLRETEEFIKTVRYSLCEQTPTLQLLAASIEAVTVFKKVISGVDVDSFHSIADRLRVVFARHLTAETIPNKIELETIELALDWLAQLAPLYVENIPEPKSLVAELLYTFDLVERSHEAESLAELVATHSEQATNSRVDPFLEDPELNVREGSARSHRDPFADDPGFGLEFDLLQRTINTVVKSKKIDDDPFGSDPSIDSETDEVLSNKPSSVASPYDVFAEDPPLADKPDNQN